MSDPFPMTNRSNDVTYPTYNGTPFAPPVEQTKQAQPPTPVPSLVVSTDNRRDAPLAFPPLAGALHHFPVGVATRPALLGKRPASNADIRPGNAKQPKHDQGDIDFEVQTLPKPVTEGNLRPANSRPVTDVRPYPDFHTRLVRWAGFSEIRQQAVLRIKAARNGVVDLSGLGLSDVPPLYDGIVELKLSNNKLGQLAEGRIPLSVEILNLAGNQMTELPADMPYERLRILNLDHNEFKTTPPQLALLSPHCMISMRGFTPRKGEYEHILIREGKAADKQWRPNNICRDGPTVFTHHPIPMPMYVELMLGQEGDLNRLGRENNRYYVKHSQPRFDPGLNFPKIEFEVSPPDSPDCPFVVSYSFTIPHNPDDISTQSVHSGPAPTASTTWPTTTSTTSSTSAASDHDEDIFDSLLDMPQYPYELPDGLAFLVPRPTTAFTASTKTATSSSTTPTGTTTTTTSTTTTTTTTTSTTSSSTATSDDGDDICDKFLNIPQHPHALSDGPFIPAPGPATAFTASTKTTTSTSSRASHGNELGHSMDTDASQFSNALPASDMADAGLIEAGKRIQSWHSLDDCGQSLKLSGLGLTRVPPGLNGVHKLDLSNNRLTEIAEYSIPESVIALDLSGNQLKRLPASLPYSRLRMLILNNNALTDLPLDMMILSNQCRVFLDNNPIPDKKVNAWFTPKSKQSGARYLCLVKTTEIGDDFRDPLSPSWHAFMEREAIPQLDVLGLKDKPYVVEKSRPVYVSKLTQPRYFMSVQQRSRSDNNPSIIEYVLFWPGDLMKSAISIGSGSGEPTMDELMERASTIMAARGKPLRSAAPQTGQT